MPQITAYKKHGNPVFQVKKFDYLKLHVLQFVVSWNNLLTISVWFYVLGEGITLQVDRFDPGREIPINIGNTNHLNIIDPFTKRHKLVHNGRFPKFEVLCCGQNGVKLIKIQQNLG